MMEEILAGLAGLLIAMSLIFAFSYASQQDRVKATKKLELCIGPVKEATYQHRLKCVELLED